MTDLTFDPAVQAAMAKWPNVPHCYGWLRLDERGNYHVPSGKLEHPALRAFIGRNYARDERGCYFFQNGPQRVFVDLAYTPYVGRMDVAGNAVAVVLHTSETMERPTGAFIDEKGRVLVSDEHRIAAVDDRDLSAVVSAGLLDEDQLVSVAGALKLKPIASADVPARFGFVQHPQAPDAKVGGL